MVIDRDTPLPWGNKLKGLKLSEMVDYQVEWISENANEADWRKAAAAERQMREEGGVIQEPPPVPEVPGTGPGKPAPAPAPAADSSPGYGGDAPRVSTKPHLPAKNHLDGVIMATHYAASELETLGWGDHPLLLQVAEAIAVHVGIRCERTGDDLKAEMIASGQIPGPRPK